MKVKLTEAFDNIESFTPSLRPVTEKDVKRYFSDEPKAKRRKHSPLTADDVPAFLRSLDDAKK